MKTLETQNNANAGGENKWEEARKGFLFLNKCLDLRAKRWIKSCSKIVGASKKKNTAKVLAEKQRLIEECDGLKEVHSSLSRNTGVVIEMQLMAGRRGTAGTVDESKSIIERNEESLKEAHKLLADLKASIACEQRPESGDQ